MQSRFVSSSRSNSLHVSRLNIPESGISEKQSVYEANHLEALRETLPFHPSTETFGDKTLPIN